MKNFQADLDKFKNKIANCEPFSVSRYGDGEWQIISGGAINLISKGNGEFKYDPADAEYAKSAEALRASFTFKNPNYYVGIGCPCCMGDKFYAMRDASGQDEEHLTWANIWVNGNYRYFVNTVIPEILKRPVGLVCHKSAAPFVNSPELRRTVTALWNIDTDAWKVNLAEIEKWREFISSRNDIVWLLAAGPFANILVHQMTEINPRGTYLDIGSAIDPWLFGRKGFTRGYLQGADTLNKICKWG